MSNGPIPFHPKANEVPLVGQPVQVIGWVITAVVVCRCERGGTLLLSGQAGTMVRCPSCGQAWGIGPGTKLHLDLARVLTPADLPPQQPA